MNYKIGIPIVAAALVATPLTADTTSEIAVDPGSNGTGEISITIQSIFGTETQTDSVGVNVTGDGDLTLFGASEPFSTCEMDDLELQLSDGQLNYEFFCLPIVGCTSLQLNFSAFSLEQLGSDSSPIDQATGDVEFIDLEFIMSFNYDISSSLFSISDSYASTAKDPSIATFGFRLDTESGDLFIDQMSMSTITGEIDPDSLPSGVDAVTTSTTVTLDNVSMSGTYDPPVSDCLGDFNDDGIVDGADFGSLLALWGECPKCQEDLNDDGVIDGADVGLFLSAWGVCPP
ncbi:MAG: hypothetical protein MK085_06280 [Phycisphaerales bacterium]|nr:hypothetical protein [Phycisphaerales bacterium]